MDEWQPLSLDSLIPISNPRDYDPESILDVNGYLLLDMPFDAVTLDEENQIFLEKQKLDSNKSSNPLSEAYKPVEKVSGLGPDQPMSRDLFCFYAKTIIFN